MSDPSLFLSNFDETPCSGIGSKTGVLGLEIGSLLFQQIQREESCLMLRFDVDR
jgi:hypothetical protein